MKSSVKSLSLRRILVATTLACLLSPAGALAETPQKSRPDNAALERAIIDAIGRGQNPATLSTQWREQNPGSSQSAWAPARTEGKALADAMDGLDSALADLQAGRGDPARLALALDQLRVADALLTAGFDDASGRTAAAGLGDQGLRVAQVRAKLRTDIDGLFSSLGIDAQDGKVVAVFRRGRQPNLTTHHDGRRPTKTRDLRLPAIDVINAELE